MLILHTPTLKRLCGFPVLLPLAALGIAAGGCSDRANRDAKDVQIHRAIVGTWTMETNRVEGVLSLHPDGSFSGYWSNMVAPRGWRSEGEWWITNGDCAMVITSKAAWNYTLHGPTGTLERIRILRLNDRELIGASDDQTNKWTRRK